MTETPRTATGDCDGCVPYCSRCGGLEDTERYATTRRGRYRLAFERRPSGVYVLATPLFILTAIRRNRGRR